MPVAGGPLCAHSPFADAGHTHTAGVKDRQAWPAALSRWSERNQVACRTLRSEAPVYASGAPAGQTLVIPKGASMSSRPETDAKRPEKDAERTEKAKEAKSEEHRKQASEELDEALEDSFPASDPPSQTARG